MALRRRPLELVDVCQVKAPPSSAASSALELISLQPAGSQSLAEPSQPSKLSWSEIPSVDLRAALALRTAAEPLTMRFDTIPRESFTTWIAAFSPICCDLSTTTSPALGASIVEVETK